MKKYYIYTQRICALLMLKGYKLIQIEPSKKREGFNVFIFKDSEKFRQDVEELINKRD